MNLGEQILSDLVALLMELYPNIEVEKTTKCLLFYQNIILKRLN